MRSPVCKFALVPRMSEATSETKILVFVRLRFHYLLKVMTTKQVIIFVSEATSRFWYSRLPPRIFCLLTSYTTQNFDEIFGGLLLLIGREILVYPNPADPPPPCWALVLPIETDFFESLGFKLPANTEFLFSSIGFTDCLFRANPRPSPKSILACC